MTSLNEAALPEAAGLLPIPSYQRRAVRTGIVHFGVGGFHRSHQAMFIDRLLNLGGSQDWGICGVGVLASDARMRDVLEDQDGLYTLVLKGADGTEDARIIGSITEYLYAPDDPAAVIRKLSDPATRIVSLSITEGGYSISDGTGEFDPRTPDILHDLKQNAVPRSAFGLITSALAHRRDQGTAPFTVMSCDNIQGNGNVAGKALVSFARLKDPELAGWIADTVAFPNSMVDRITPVTTDHDRAAVTEAYGFSDAWPVVAEPFEQWVLEDKFTAGRPPLEDVGVQIVDDVEPYELMKLRLLNASHQVMSYLGYLAGYRFVHEVCADPLFAEFISGFMEREATPTLRPVPGIDLQAYRNELIHRFANPAIRDTLARQMVDASERIPKFVLPVVREQLELGGPIDRAVLVIAAWARFLESTDEHGEPVAITDRRLDELRAAARADQVEPGAFLNLTEIFGDLGRNARFAAAYRQARKALERSGARTAVQDLTELLMPTRSTS
ncbi:mannitol dehydrogenase family protein [Pseudarthrobacter raffinosi]|uniref:mannitol dehydrogenase family protein n=1 Tax=Pseudarthrobacter raffinosi TaxID=2953651 RepID=UPI00208F509D|nr:MULTISPECIES: mannitol dehydrogenase family protein [unclassified Pseudarthrobacter]MCO4238180.1 mannitol dehydrogenase family protein [Pseudarthrobacter sp. MDT3-28]MCO4252628.1 mannitol dehydrogenase family protein [Pseudarthrobacter sp. MDT3-9]